MAANRKRTRPPQTDLNRLRTIVWYATVKRALGLPTAYKIEKKVDADKFVQIKGETKRNSKWDRYSRGERVPNDKPDGSIERAENEAPGTARWFRSPIWDVLQDKLLLRHEIEDYLGSIPAIEAILFPRAIELELPDDIGGVDDITPLQSRNLALDNVPRCAILDGIDLLETVVLLLVAGTGSGSAKLTKAARELYVAATPKIAEIVTVSTYFPLLFEAIEDRFANNADTDWQGDLVAPWYVRLPDLEDPRYDIEADVADYYAQQ